VKIGLHVTTYNRLQFTEQCLKSIEWSKPVNSVVVIVDNNSDDGTKEFLKSYASPLLKQVVFNDENKGLGFAINQGWNILKDECDILGVINNDFLFEPGWEENVLACFEDLRVDYVMVAVLPNLESEMTSSGKGFYVKTLGSVSASCFLLSKHFRNGIAPSARPFEKGYVGPGASFYHKRIRAGLRGVQIASPGILLRNPEYTNPKYAKYYDEVFGIRSIDRLLRERRINEAKGKPVGFTDWNKFLNKYYPNEVE